MTIVYFCVILLTMGKEKYSKLNKFLHNWPQGTVCTATSIINSGYSYELINKYKNSNWITQIGNGAYTINPYKLSWEGAIYAIQEQLQLPIHPGGLTALRLKGYANNIPLQNEKVFLFGYKAAKLPRWFKNYNWGFNIQLTTTNLFPKDCTMGFSEYPQADFSIQISSPERAAFELVYHVPKYVTFSQSLLIIENLTTLRPNVVQELLRLCSSIRVKRLFLYMADYHNQPWFKKIDISKVYLGKGKRVVVKNGVLDKKYLITIPKQLSVTIF